jgi:hypothetical protein
MMRPAWLLCLVACGASRSPGGGGGADAGMGGNDAPPACTVTLSFSPTDAVAPTTVRATADVENGPGVFQFVWTVTYQDGTPIDTTPASDAPPAVDFTAQYAGVYHVDVTPTGGSCPDGLADENVMQTGAITADYRLRVWPPPSLAPTQEQVIEVSGGADFHRDIALDPGLALAGTVTNGTSGVPAYLRFMPASAPDAYGETFAASDGTFALRVLGQSHQVLIVPAAPGLAPVLASWSPGTTTFTVGPGTTITGKVLDGAGAALAGATVQLASGGVPSTLATTAADGSFTVHESFAPAALVAVSVAPPAGRGLPRLAASATFDLSQSLQIRYATLATANLAGTAITRGGANLAGVQVQLVGTLAAAAGTVTAGTTAAATGTVAIAGTADATGMLPAMLAPRAPLSAVVTVTSKDFAVAAVDLTGGAPAAIDAPAQTTATGLALDPASTALAGVQVDASPGGALAAAGLSDVQTMSAGDGTFALSLATAGIYDVRFTDPQGRAAPVTVAATSPAALPATVQLAPAIHVSGQVSVSGDADPIIGASIQILCTNCSGVAAARPVAETATDAASNFRLAIPDPGTM